MTFNEWTDGVTPVTAADLAALQTQGAIPFATVAARSTAIPTPVVDQMTAIAATRSLERWTGSNWEVVYASPIRASLSATPPTTTDASLSTSIGTFTLPAGSYRFRGLVRVSAGTCKLTTLAANTTGFWGNAVNGEDAALFDRTSADSIVALVQGINPVDGSLTVSTATTLTLYAFYQVTSAVIESGSFIQAERTG